jgi:hypothetical protein
MPKTLTPEEVEINKECDVVRGEIIHEIAMEEYTDETLGEHDFENMFLRRAAVARITLRASQEEAGLAAIEIKDVRLLLNSAEIALSQSQQEVEKLKLEYNEEVDEFNAGHTAFTEGRSVDDEPSGLKYDVWRAGFAFAAFASLKSDKEKLIREMREAHARLNELGIRVDYNDGEATLDTRIQWLEGLEEKLIADLEQYKQEVENRNSIIRSLESRECKHEWLESKTTSAIESLFIVSIGMLLLFGIAVYRLFIPENPPLQLELRLFVCSIEAVMVICTGLIMRTIERRP